MESRRYDIKPGDWACFYKNGVLVISCVRYIKTDVVRGRKAMTDAGQVDFDSVLEVRRDKLMTDEPSE